MADSESISAAVARLYDTYPFPPEPLLTEPPLGYNWRWNWQTAYTFCTGRKPTHGRIRILDAGCGTGVSTEYLVYLNPQATVVGIDLSAGALAVARDRCHKSGVDRLDPTGTSRVEFQHLSLFDVEQLPGEFDLINCVGVLHHTPDPHRGIQALAQKLAPGGLLHIFVYAELGRWEVKLMQEAISLIQGDQRGNYADGVAIGRTLFKTLPANNRLRQREEERWSWENQRDSCFADMYVHPQEIDYSVGSLFDLIDASGLTFVGFSNPQVWDLSRLLAGAPELLERAGSLSERQRYRLVEVLDPSQFTHYEFFLARPPLPHYDWGSDPQLLTAIPERSPCINGWESSAQFFNQDYHIVNLNAAEWNFLKACDGHLTVAQVLSSVESGLDAVRSLQRQQLLLLTPMDP